MKKAIMMFLTLCVFLTGCGSSKQATVDVLETCKVISSTITETSISADKEYFTITFDNGIFYCEDNTTGYTIYTIKVPSDKEIDVYAILKSIVPKMTEENYTELEKKNYTHFFRAYRSDWHIYKELEGATIKYTIK